MWDSQARAWVEQHFSFILLAGVAAGLFLPGIDDLPPVTPIILISLVMFFSCAKVSLQELREIHKGAAFLFVPARFILLPALLYLLAEAYLPHYAMGVLLIALMPVGVASTAIANLTGGNGSLTLSATVLSNALPPLFVPVMLWALSGESVALDTLSLFRTLALSVFVPSALYFGAVRRHTRLKLWVKRESQAASTLLLGCMATSVIALQRHYILNNLDEVVLGLLVTGGLYLVLYLAGWLYSLRMDSRDRRSYAICSGVNNIALSAGLAALYFSAHTTVFTVIGEITWILAVACFKRVVEWQGGRQQAHYSA
jgi:predicted Na+-dependent transporter